MDRLSKYKLIKEKIQPDFERFWTGRYDGNLFFLGSMELDKFKAKYGNRFSEKFLKSLRADRDHITRIPFENWIDEFMIHEGEE